MDAPSPKRAKSHEPDESRDCLICLEPFAQSGEHQISCLRCGHLFGHCCIVKWLKAKRWCPACQGQAKEKDVRKLFVATITAQDDSATRKVEQALSLEVRRRQSAERRLVEKDVELQTLRQQLTLRAAAASAMPSTATAPRAVAQPLRPLVDAGNCATALPSAPPAAAAAKAAASSQFAPRHALEPSSGACVASAVAAIGPSTITEEQRAQIEERKQAALAKLAAKRAAAAARQPPAAAPQQQQPVEFTAVPAPPPAPPAHDPPAAAFHAPPLAPSAQVPPPPARSGESLS